MKTIKKEFTFSFIKNENIYDDIKEVHCDSKSLFNIFMLLFTIIYALPIGYYIGQTFYFDFVDNRLSFNFTNIMFVLGILLFIASPAVYYILKIVNFKFYINNENVNYKNIFGKTFSYSLTEILKAEFFASTGASDCIVIKFTDKRNVKISSTDRNFRMLKGFLLSKNILVR
jgi:hypothetical protein